MTRDEITSIAREAGFVGMDADHGALRRFAALVAAAEREACAQICVGMSAKPEFGLEIQDRMLLAAAKKILDRGEKGQS